MRDAVKEFANAMEKKLQKHDHDRGVEGWKQDATADLLGWLKNEVVELEVALISEDKSNEEIGEECADVANFAMMIFDNHHR